MKIQASVFIISKNEQEHIARVLKSVEDFDEVILVDSGSTDNTLNIAKQFDVKIYHHDFEGYAQQKEYAKNLCKNEWVLNLDCDEELTVGLKNTILDTISKNYYDAIEVDIASYYMNKAPHKLIKSINKIRVFKKQNASYIKNNDIKLVHESINLTTNCKILKTTQKIYDYGLDDIKKHIYKINLYSSLIAKEKFLKNKKPKLLKLVFVFVFSFFKSFILKRNFLNGKIGFILSMNLAFYAFLKEAKLFEIYQNQTNTPQ